MYFIVDLPSGPSGRTAPVLAHQNDGRDVAVSTGYQLIARRGGGRSVADPPQVLRSIADHRQDGLRFLDPRGVLAVGALHGGVLPGDDEVGDLPHLHRPRIEESRPR